MIKDYYEIKLEIYPTIIYLKSSFSRHPPEIEAIHQGIIQNSCGHDLYDPQAHVASLQYRKGKMVFSLSH